MTDGDGFCDHLEEVVVDYYVADHAIAVNNGAMVINLVLPISVQPGNEITIPSYHRI